VTQPWKSKKPRPLGGGAEVISVMISGRIPVFRTNSVRTAVIGCKKSRPEGPAGAAHSMKASAQVTAPGAVTNRIVAVNTRPNRQNRSTCSRMSVPWFEVARADCTSESVEMCELLNTEKHYCFDANNKGALYFPERRTRAGVQGRVAICALMNTRPSTTLADLLMPLLAANPFSTMRASLRR